MREASARRRAPRAGTTRGPRREPAAIPGGLPPGARRTTCAGRCSGCCSCSWRSSPGGSSPGNVQIALGRRARRRHQGVDHLGVRASRSTTRAGRVPPLRVLRRGRGRHGRDPRRRAEGRRDAARDAAHAARVRVGQVPGRRGRASPACSWSTALFHAIVNHVPAPARSGRVRRTVRARQLPAPGAALRAARSCCSSPAPASRSAP